MRDVACETALPCVLQTPQWLAVRSSTHCSPHLDHGSMPVRQAARPRQLGQQAAAVGGVGHIQDAAAILGTVMAPRSVGPGCRQRPCQQSGTQDGGGGVR